MMINRPLLQRQMQLQPGTLRSKKLEVRGNERIKALREARLAKIVNEDST